MMAKRTDTLYAMAPKQEVMHNLPMHYYYRAADNTLLKVSPRHPHQRSRLPAGR